MENTFKENNIIDCILCFFWHSCYILISVGPSYHWHDRCIQCTYDVVTSQHLQLGALFYKRTDGSTGLYCQMELDVSDLEEDEKQLSCRLLYSAFKNTNTIDSTYGMETTQRAEKVKVHTSHYN